MKYIVFKIETLGYEILDTKRDLLENEIGVMARDDDDLGDIIDKTTNRIISLKNEKA